MGVKELWTVLSPVSEKKALWELKDKTIAVDLSAWICDSQNVGDSSQRNMYLRNLFFRTSFLLLLGAKPLFVLEGVAPELKHATIAARSQARNGKDLPVPKSGSRSHLRNLQVQCEKFLKTLGVPCVQGGGEAEAYCAWLNETGIVDAVITQDSDSLLYGAQTVYRNFTMSPSYSCEAYDMAVIEKKLQLGREKLLAVSLLCGSDYNKGVNGVGKESAVKFLSSLKENETLDRLRSWSSNTFKYELLEKKKKSEITPEQKLELNIRKKALQIPGFPSEEIINEYLHPKPGESVPMIGWLQPNLPNFLKIAEKKLAWEEEYAIEKFLPLMTRWHLLHSYVPSVLKCESIKKRRVIRGINSFECKWSAQDLMLSDSTVDLTTSEPQDLVTKAYESMVEEFIASKTKSKKGAKKTTRKNKTDRNDILKDITNAEALLLNLSLEEKTEKQANKKRIKNKSEKGLQTLDRFVINNKKVNFPNVIHSTPNKDLLKEKNDIEENNLNISYHYISDTSPSPLRTKRKSSLNFNSKLGEKSVSKSLDITSNWSLNDFLQHPLRGNDKVITNSVFGNRNNTISKTETSMTASFLNISNENCDFNMSDIVNSIITSENVNPAVDILLDAKNTVQKYKKKVKDSTKK